MVHVREKIVNESFQINLAHFGAGMDEPRPFKVYT